MHEVLDRSTGPRLFRHRGVVDGVTLTVSYAVDLHEHERRSAMGIGAIVDELLLAGLLSLPVDDLALVDNRFGSSLASDSASGLVALVEDPLGGLWGRRHLRCPIEIVELETDVLTWRRGCALVQGWVGYGPRTVHVDRDLSAFELTEAAHYGIGVVRDGERLLAPGEYRPHRWSSARWRFAELIYGQFLALS